MSIALRVAELLEDRYVAARSAVDMAGNPALRGTLSANRGTDR